MLDSGAGPYELGCSNWGVVVGSRVRDGASEPPTDLRVLGDGYRAHGSPPRRANPGREGRREVPATDLWCDLSQVDLAEDGASAGGCGQGGLERGTMSTPS